MNAQDLKTAGLKVTLPRLKILQILETNENHHMSAEDIYRALLLGGEEVGVATVYRVLTQFEQAGMINKLNFDNGQSVFELSNAEHHDHLVCVKCGKIDEFQDSVIEQHQRDVATQHGYQLTDHCLYLYGLCKDCQ
ncbi:MAG: ferric iron uptake transcriptional regulator [Candidatus Thioglobus sp.]|nr:ferric iron uptake transcriptional regulator [Candidatus Thioglobus sp.]